MNEAGSGVIFGGGSYHQEMLVGEGRRGCNWTALSHKEKDKDKSHQAQKKGRLLDVFDDSTWEIGNQVRYSMLIYCLTETETRTLNGHRIIHQFARFPVRSSRTWKYH